MKVTVDLVFFLLAAATVLFLLATAVIRQWARGWQVPLGLACTSLAILVQWKF